MDLIPKPDQVMSAAGNVAHMVFSGGVADLRPMPRTLVDEGELRELYHYRPAADVVERGDPVLLVTPLAAPALCYDLRRGCSLVEHLLGAGRPTYLVEYGAVDFRDRSLAIDPWVDDVVPTAIAEVSRRAGGRPVHVLGWSLGGVFSLLSLADRPDLPVASLSVLGVPADVTQVPLVAPARPLVNLPDTVLTRAYRAVGGGPQPLVGWALQLPTFQKLVTRPLAVASQLDDTEFLAQIEAVDRFTAKMDAYPGRSFGQLYHRFVKGTGLVTGSFDLGDRTIEPASITTPVLVVAGANDGIAPVASVRALVPALAGSPEVRFEIAPGGHLGMLTGRAARDSTWEVLDEWLTQWSGKRVATAPRKKASRKKAAAKKAPAKKAPAKRTVAKKTATQNAPAKKTVAKKAPAKKQAPSAEIGTNPARRYRSAGSRGLAR